MGEVWDENSREEEVRESKRELGTILRWKSPIMSCVRGRKKVNGEMRMQRD